MGWRRYSLVVLAAVGLALAMVVVAWRAGPRPMPASAPPVMDASVQGGGGQPVQAARSGHRWSVKIDGWTIELDKVARRPIPALEAELLPPLLSAYDQMIARHAEAAGLDWRFVSAVVFEESRFDPDAASIAGAIGLMQVMPVAAADVGAVRFHAPEDNIRTGVRYLQRLAREYAAARERDRLALMLAAYNMGVGHVRDAQRLATRFGYHPLTWDGAMDVMVSLLEEPQVLPALRHGFAQGRSVVAYVDRVLTRYASYRRTLPATLPAAMAAQP